MVCPAYPSTPAPRGQRANLLTVADVNLTTCQGMREAEFEDLLAEELINGVLATSYRINQPQVPRESRRKKWSERMESVFGAAGKIWSERTCTELKMAVAQAVDANPAGALNAHRRQVFDALVSTLKARLEPSAQ